MGAASWQQFSFPLALESINTFPKKKKESINNNHTALTCNLFYTMINKLSSTNFYSGSQSLFNNSM